MMRYIQYKWIVVSVLAWLVVAISGCTQTETQVDEGICSPGERLESDGQVTCVYEQEIIETGFDCPAEVPHQQSYGDYEVCSEQERLPDGFPGEMNERYPDGNLPSDGCVTDSQCSGAQTCNAGDCEAPMPDNGGPSDTGVSDAGSDTGPNFDPIDTGAPDSGSLPDAGDAGQVADASDTDTGPDTGPDAGPPSCADHLEPNDTLAQAPVLTAGDYLNLNLCDGEDYYELQLSPGDEFRVELEYDRAASAGELQMHLFDDTGRGLLGGSEYEELSSGVTRLVIPGNNPDYYDVTTQNTTFYVLVSRFSGIGIEYELTVDVQ